MKTDLLNEIDQSTAGLLNAIELFTTEQFNRIPFEGSWTAGQVAEHVYKSEAGIPKIWRGSSIATERDPDEKSAVLKSIFLDFSKKLTPPDFILPTDEPKEVEALYNAIKAKRQEIRKLAEEADLTRTFTGASFPQLGELTGLEWATFMISHSKRHTFQITNIFNKIANQ